MTVSLAPPTGRRVLHSRRRPAPVSAAARLPEPMLVDHDAPAAVVPRFEDARLRASSPDSTTLLRRNKTVQILHNGSIYTLQATKLGKLILTK